MILMMLAVPGKIVAAQVDEDTYEFSSGQVLEWSGAWEIDPETSGMEAGLELVLLTQTLSFLAVMSVPVGLNVDSTRDAFLDGFLGASDASITIDRGAYGAVSYSLDTVLYDDIEMGAFTLFRASETGGETFAWIFVSLIDTFSSEFSDAQDSFTLDGSPPFTGIDGQGLRDQLASAAADGDVREDDDDRQTTPATTETPEILDPTEETSGSGGGLKGGREAATEEPEVPDEADDDVATKVEQPSDGADAGLVDSGTYISPAYGITVEWSDGLSLSTDRDPNPAANASGVETVALTSAAVELPLFVTVNLTTGNSSASDYAEVWSSADYLAENAQSPDAEVILVEGNEEVAGVVFLDYLDDGTPLVFYYEFRVDAATGNLTLLEFYTAAVFIEQGLPIVQDGLSIEGDGALTFFSVAEVLEAAGL